MLDEWLVHKEPRLRNMTYNRYAGFLKQLFDITVKDRIISESPARQLRQGWKKPQAVRRLVPTVTRFEAIVADIRAQVASPHAQATGDFVEFLGLAGLGAATRAKEVLVLSSVAKVPWKMSHPLGAILRGGTASLGNTVACQFINELGAQAQPARYGPHWVKAGFN